MGACAKYQSLCNNDTITIEMAAEGPVDEIPEFVREIFYPSALPSFRESMPSGEVEVHLHRRPSEQPSILRLMHMFPFMTLQDIKTAICIQLPKELNAIPEFLYICQYGSQPGKQYVGGRTAPIDFSWNFPVKEPYLIAEPFKLMSSPEIDTRFVDSGGGRRLVSMVERERLTIEDAFFKKGVSQGIPIIHAYLYADLLGSIPGAKPPSERDWNGRLYPLFPQLSTDTVEPSAEQKAAAARGAVVFARRQQFLVRIESILERDIPLVPLTMAGIKYLQLIWDAKKNTGGIETYFYDAVVNERRPFMRFIPTEGSGLSKVFLKDGNVPDIQDPNLLVQWSQDRTPTPDQDFAFGKIMLRRGVANVPPIYATLQLLNDGTALCILEPPKGVKKLEPRNDLESFGEHLVEGLENLPYIDTMPEIDKGSFVLGLHVKKGADAVITPRILRERLPIFSSMFQEISPLPGERPMAMLRFKLVSNFAREDRIQTFLSQVIQRKVLRGEGYVSDLVDIVAEEFQLDYDEARKQVAKKLQTQGEISLVVPETKEYMRQNNPGIDIAIFAQHPFYTFHLYNVNSLENLRRIVTALSVLMSASSDDLQVGAKAVKELAAAEAFVAKEEEEEEEKEEVEAEAEAAAAAPATEGEEAEAAAPAAPAAPAAEEHDEFDDAGDMADYLDVLAFDQESPELTLAQAHAEDEAAAAARLGGEARPEPPLSGEESAKPMREPTRKIGEAVAGMTVAPKEELQGMAAAAAAAPQEEMPEQTGETGIANFFLNKLKAADSRLFDYAKSNPSLKRYVSQCQPTYGRQPAVLSEEKFIEMQEEYAKDGVTFQVFPLQPGEPTKPPGIPEKDYYTVLKYGSSPQRQNYYLCSKYFCTQDEILVRESDLQGTQMRRPYRRADGSTTTAKNPGECPFCRGRVIKNRRSPAAGETIMERVIKPPTHDKRHLFIGFINKTPHPEGFYLPCCFTEEVPIKFKGNPAFDKYREWGANVRPVNQAALEHLGGEEDLAPPVDEGKTMISYFTTLSQVQKKYIVGAEKLPLDIGSVSSGARGEAQIGLLPNALNTFFDQDPTNIVSRAFNPQKIKPGGTGFLRIAVENRHRFQNDSFLAAVAPFYGKNTSAEMKEHIIENLHPREFLALNYGNMAIEFYDPANAPAIKEGELKDWASKYLQVDTHEGSENEEAVARAYLSFNAFQEWLLSDKSKKEYRQFALLFAQSPLLRKAYPSGITFIVLDILKDDTVKARCPPYGFNAGLMAKNDVAFIMHHWSGIWEPIFYVDNRTEDDRDDLFSLVFQYAGRSAWPPIVQKRLGEFMAQCSSPGRAIYTSQSKIHSLAMIPSSYAKTILEKDANIIFDGVIRDAYNHIGALTFRERDIKQGTVLPGVVIIPVVDDGELVDGKNLYMDWEDSGLEPAPLDQTLRFYKKYVETRFSYYPGFMPTYIIKVEKSGSIEAIQLRNGLYVPVEHTAVEDLAKHHEGSPTRTVSEMEWSKNHEICLEEKTDETESEQDRMNIAEFQEIFEHLRLTFSNWLAMKKDGGEFRAKLEGVIFSRKLPLVEKRKRMEILLRREVEDWITTDFDDEDVRAKRDVSLLRVDCTLKGQEECGGRCVWKQEKEKCLLHAPKETQLGEQEKKVSAPRVLFLRLIEELLRYGERRRQLLEQDVSRLSVLDRPVKIPDNRCLVCKKTKKEHGDETHEFEADPAIQVIFPEKSAAWFDLLRLEWAAKPDEKPRFLEEMGRVAEDVSVAPQDETTALPPALVTVLNGAAPDPKTQRIRLLRGTWDGLLVPLRLTMEEIEIPEEAESLDESMLRRIVRKTGGNVFQIDIREDPPVFSGKKPVRTIYENMPTPVFVITNEGAGILVLNPAAPQLLTRNDMPTGLQNALDSVLAREKGVIGINVKPKAAAAPAPAAAAAAVPAPVAAAPPPPPTLGQLRAERAREAQLLFPPAPPAAPAAAAAPAGKTIGELRAERLREAQLPAPPPPPQPAEPAAFPEPPPPNDSA